MDDFAFKTGENIIEIQCTATNPRKSLSKWEKIVRNEEKKWSKIDNLLHIIKIWLEWGRMLRNVVKIY